MFPRVPRAISPGRVKQLIDTATDVFIAEGYGRAQMDDVARALGVADPYLVKFIRPVHSQIISLHFVLLLYYVVSLPSALNGMFALYWSSKGQLSIEPLAPSSRWSGQSALDPPEALGSDGPHSSKLLKSVSYR